MNKFKVLKDREEWLKHRTKIGGSDAAAIVGLNPYMNNQDLWEFKTGRRVQEDISDKPYVKYGTQAEQPIRELFKLDFPEYEVFYEENNMFSNSDYPFGHASLDGWLKDKDGRNGILEIKTTNIVHSMQREKWKDRLPDNYYIQIVHYFMITGFDFAILKAQFKTDFKGEITLNTKHYEIERADVEHDIEFLAAQEADFWEYVKKDERPPLILPNI